MGSAVGRASMGPVVGGASTRCMGTEMGSIVGGAVGGATSWEVVSVEHVSCHETPIL